MEQINKLDFSGQSIYVGLDVHKKSWSVSIFSEHGEPKRFTQPPEADKLVHYLKRNFPGAAYHSAYEAGFSGFWAHDQLQEQGVNCIVVHPADVPTTDKDLQLSRAGICLLIKDWFARLVASLPRTSVNHEIGLLGCPP